MTNSFRHGVGSAVLVATIAMVWARGARAEDWGTPGLDAPTHQELGGEVGGGLFADNRWCVGFPGGARLLASPAVAEGLVVAIDLEGAIHALRAADGALVWTAEGGAPVQGSPALVHGRLMVPTVGNDVVAMRVADGKPLWRRKISGGWSCRRRPPWMTTSSSLPGFPMGASRGSRPRPVRWSGRARP